MASMSMAEHFANTDIKDDLPHGEYDVSVLRTMVKPGKVERRFSCPSDMGSALRSGHDP